MRQNSLLILFYMIVIMQQSCIIPFEPDIDIKDINKYVVAGQVVDNKELQTVSVSMASSVGEPKYIPVSGCYIRIFDDRGNEFPMYESGSGVYNVTIDRSYLIPERSFKVDILTPDGTSLESEFDKMNECPVVDSVYYSLRELPTEIVGYVNQELQFYVDLDAGNLSSRYFKWEAVETWEYHADHPREWYYDGSVHRIIPPDSSRMVCWSTELVKNIYTITTQNLDENRYNKLPLHIVTNHSPKMIYGYSLLINQYAMSEAAYSYWDQLRINSSEQGGLYEKQPLAIIGNLHNNTDPDQKVLGFFSASSVKSKRIFLRNVENFEIDYTNPCKPMVMEYGGFLEISPWDYPAFLLANPFGYSMATLSNECVDCLTGGGINIKPDFWPN
jgi:hypothetical protein